MIRCVFTHGQKPKQQQMRQRKKDWWSMIFSWLRADPVIVVQRRGLLDTSCRITSKWTADDWITANLGVACGRPCLDTEASGDLPEGARNSEGAQRRLGIPRIGVHVEVRSEKVRMIQRWVQSCYSTGFRQHWCLFGKTWWTAKKQGEGGEGQAFFFLEDMAPRESGEGLDDVLRGEAVEQHRDAADRRNGAVEQLERGIKK